MLYLAVLTFLLTVAGGLVSLWVLGQERRDTAHYIASEKTHADQEHQEVKVFLRDALFLKNSATEVLSQGHPPGHFRLTPECCSRLVEAGFTTVEAVATATDQQLLAALGRDGARIPPVREFALEYLEQQNEGLLSRLENLRDERKLTRRSRELEARNNKNIILWVKILLTALVAPFAAFIIISKTADASAKNFAYTTIGTLIGYWLSGNPK